MNTLLENAIQEAMAELDKKSEGSDKNVVEGTSREAVGAGSVTETPKRTRKHDKIRKDRHHKKKLAPSASKPDEGTTGTRLRSTR